MRTIRVNEQIELHPNREGILSIWEHPEEGETYFVGSDTAEGIDRGDWSVAEVVRGSDCALVAEARTRMDPTNWGIACARIATYFNTALLAFEAFPSAHGLNAHEAAREYGYTRLYHRRVQDVLSKTWTEKIGWRTDVVTKPKMIDRIRVALDRKHAIPSAELLRELSGIQFKRMAKSTSERDTSSAGWKAVSRGHDDCHDAYAIALCVRDEMFFEKADRRRRQHDHPVTLQEKMRKHMQERGNRNILPLAGPRRTFDGS